MKVYASKFSRRCAYLTRILATFIGGFGLLRGVVSFFWCLVNWAIRPPNWRFETTSPQGERITLRARSSDLAVYSQVILGAGYEVPGIESGGIITLRYDKLISKGRLPIIIDGGGNIGLTALYFSKKFPSAKILLIEPDNENMQLAKINTSKYLNIQYYQCGLWSKTTNIVPIDAQAKSWSFQFREASPDEASSVTLAKSIDDILADLPTTAHVFIVKLDVEGTEGLILNANSEWLTHVPVLMIEPHDYHRPGQHLLSGVLKNSDYHNADLLLRSDIVCFIPNPSGA
jgi:FkbM family methyltransferase